MLQYPLHAGVQRWVRDLNRFYRDEPALYELDFSPEGFEWIDCNDGDASVHVVPAQGPRPDDLVLVVCNFTPVPREQLPRRRAARRTLARAPQQRRAAYGGSGQGNLGGVDAAPVGAHGRLHSLTLRLPPLAALYFTPEGRG